MVIARIKLAPGNAGWYDPLSNIHLTIANPYADIRAGMQLTNIKRGLSYKTILLVSGTVEEAIIIEQIEEQQAQAQAAKKILQNGAKQEVIETVQEALVAEEVAVVIQQPKEAVSHKTGKKSKKNK